MITQTQLDKRMAQEREVVQFLIRTAANHGYVLRNVYDGGDQRVTVTTEAEAMEAVFAVDEANIYFKRPDEVKGHCAVIVLGNSGPECIADCSMGGLWDDVIAEVNSFTDRMEEANDQACCENETRSRAGGCTNCGDPCL